MTEIRSIQYLRALAALLVVIYHLGEALARLGYTGGWRDGLSGGVDIFFIISGFIMWQTTRDRALTPLAFWRKRLIRIVPLYWLVTTFMLVVLLAAPQFINASRFELHHVIFSYLFLPALNPGKEVMEPLLFPGWTLNYEMLFYLIFGIFLLAPVRIRLLGMVMALIMLTLAGANAQVPVLSMEGFYTDPIMLEFAMGILLSEVTHRDPARALLPRGCEFPAILIGLALLVATPFPPQVHRVATFGLPALLIVIGALAVERAGKLREWPLLHFLGNASYSIYLVQLIAMAGFLVVWRKLPLPHGPAAWVVFALLDVTAAIAFGALAHVGLERPLLRLFTGRSPRKTA